jgi:hypothetical protein
VGIIVNNQYFAQPIILPSEGQIPALIHKRVQHLYKLCVNEAAAPGTRLECQSGDCFKIGGRGV